MTRKKNKRSEIPGGTKITFTVNINCQRVTGWEALFVGTRKPEPEVAAPSQVSKAGSALFSFFMQKPAFSDFPTDTSKWRELGAVAVHEVSLKGGRHGRKHKLLQQIQPLRLICWHLRGGQLHILYAAGELFYSSGSQIIQVYSSARSCRKELLPSTLSSLLFFSLPLSCFIHMQQVSSLSSRGNRPVTRLSFAAAF